MKRAGGWSISQRIALGFALIFVVVGSLAIAAAWHLAQNEAASERVEQILSRTQHAQQVERALLYLAIATRDVVRERTEEHLARFSESDARLTQAMVAIGQLDLDRRAQIELDAARPFVDKYLAESRHTVENRSYGVNGELISMRYSALAHIQAILAQENRMAAATLERMSANRRDATVTLAVGAVLAGLFLLLIGYFTVRSVRRPAQQLVRVAARLDAGDWSEALVLRRVPDESGAVRDEMARIGHAFGTAARTLELREKRLKAHAEIANAAASSLELTRIGELSLQAVLAHLGAQLGAIYVFQGEARSLVPVATHALSLPLATLVAGEGIVGQAARDGTPCVVRGIAEQSSVRLNVGYGDIEPRVAAAIPILFKSETLGVMLVASLHELGEDALEFLSVAAAQIGVGVMNVRAFEEAQRLLKETRRQSERIQAQNEELQAQNEEIQAQSEEIQAQSEEIQAQSEEIQAQNADLRRSGEELLQISRSLEEADGRKNEFLGVLAHELRNPLAPMSNCVHLLKQRGRSDAQLVELVDILARQMRHLSRLVDDLLDVTRITRGKIVIRRERLNVIEALNQCLADQRAELDQRKILVSLDLPDTPIHVLGDHTRLCQVFSNLLINAVKFSRPERSSQIHVSVRLDAEAGHVAIEFVDNGVGIDAGLLPRVFEPFTQGTSDLARTAGGLGLGLPLAKGLVELHGGRIEASSEGPDRGAKFVVVLPLADVRADKHEPEAVQEDAELIRLHREPVHAVQRVFVVDDNIDAADTLARVLRLQGHQVAIAYSAREALLRAPAFEPDVLLCDIGLPGMDGYELATLLRAHPALAKATLVAVTGYAGQADRSVPSSPVSTSIWASRRISIACSSCWPNWPPASPPRGASRAEGGQTRPPGYGRRRDSGSCPGGGAVDLSACRNQPSMRWWPSVNGCARATMHSPR